VFHASFGMGKKMKTLIEADHKLDGNGSGLFLIGYKQQVT
jgi:hypothetical protein